MTATLAPDAAMMAPVHAVASFMATLDEAKLARVFTDDIVIVENFAPYVFRGENAALRWRDGFRDHAAGLSGLVAIFGPAQDFSSSGDAVYFVLPTVWTGMVTQKTFKEEGGWAFVLRQDGGAAGGSQAMHGLSPRSGSSSAWPGFDSAPGTGPLLRQSH